MKIITTSGTTICLLITLIATLTPSAEADEINHADKASVTASSARENAAANLIVDGLVADKSRWLATEVDQQPWIEIAFPQPQKVGMIDVFSGYKTGDSLQGLLGICFLRGAPEDVVVEIGEGEKGGYGGKRGWNKCIVMGEQWSGKRKAQKVKNDW